MAETKLTFKEWLAQQGEVARQEAARQDAVAQWVEELSELFSEMDEWLHEDDEDRVLRISVGKVALNEEGLGRYEAPTRSIFLQDKAADLIPVARHVVGAIGTRGDPGIRAEGRVDMTNGVDRYMLYRAVYPDGTKWVMVDDDTYTVRKLDKKNFEEALQDLLS